TSRSASFLASLSDIDILSLNSPEAAALVPLLVGKFGDTGCVALDVEPADAPTLLRYGLNSGGHEISLAGFMRALQNCGVPIVLVTNGADGAYVGTGRHIYHCPTLPVEVVGTAGAGDAFAATFATWMTETGDPRLALSAATLNAASVIGYADTQTGLLKRPVLDDRIAGQASQLKIEDWIMSGDC
ncbi:MAG: carbohydrate kinase family protein, partial [Hyphomicrobiaceae bacterium]